MNKNLCLFSTSEYDSYLFVSPGKEKQQIIKKESEGYKHVRTVKQEDFSDFGGQEFIVKAPKGMNVLLFLNPTNIPENYYDLSAIIDNNGRPFAVIDVETTGLNIMDGNRPGEDRVIELGIVMYDDNADFAGIHQWYFTPGFALSEEVISLTGITNETLELSGVLFEDEAKDIFDLLSGCDIIAYNASFDVSAIEAEFMRIESDSPITEGVTVLDPLTIARKQIPHSLYSMFHVYGLGESCQYAPHSAVDDCLATAALLKQQLILGETGGSLDSLWPHYLAPFMDPGGKFISDDEGKVRFNFGKYKGELLFRVLQSDMNYIEWLKTEADLGRDVSTLLSVYIAKYEAWKASVES